MAEMYLAFVVNRHKVWELRRRGVPGPWSMDPVLRAHKFTNVFRILDHGSQFLFTELLSEPDISVDDTLMRAFLYRYTNRPEPWEFFRKIHGKYPTVDSLDGTLLHTWREFRDNGGSVFGPAYKMFSGLENKGTDRLTWAVNLTADYFAPWSGKNIVSEFERALTMRRRLEILQTIPRCARFMSMQIVTDVGYSPLFEGDENEMVIPGPGAERGAKHLSGGRVSALEVIAWAREVLVTLPDCPRLAAPSGTFRPPSCMDVQNTLCEFSKYVRYSEAGVSGRREYSPAHQPRHAEPALPRHW